PLRSSTPAALTTATSSLSLHDALPIYGLMREFVNVGEGVMDFEAIAEALKAIGFQGFLSIEQDKHPGDMKATCRRYLEMMKGYLDRKSTRLNSSHRTISYAVFCLKKKK